MTSTNVKTLLFFMACFLFGCSNNPNQSKHTEQQEANVKQDSLPQVESNTEPSSVALQDKPVSETFYPSAGENGSIPMIKQITLCLKEI